ncbi:MAG TPA: SDR family NAD(P)-dependent oxidoreductase [Polyangiaceae bacterium]
MKTKESIALVTGANRGLGRALVQTLLSAGARRIYAGARDPRTLLDLVSQGEGRIIPIALDVANPASLLTAAESARDVTLLVNNAGVLASYDVLGSTAAQVAEDFAVNCFGVVSATKAFLPALERAGRASGAALLNVLSVVSLANMPSLGGYSASKAAAFSFTQALRAELGTRGIEVFAAFPGPIDTDMVRAMDMKKTSPEDVARAIVEGLTQGILDIAPDPVSRELLALWKQDPKALERQFASAAA